MIGAVNVSKEMLLLAFIYARDTIRNKIGDKPLFKKIELIIEFLERDEPCVFVEGTLNSQDFSLREIELIHSLRNADCFQVDCEKNILVAEKDGDTEVYRNVIAISDKAYPYGLNYVLSNLLDEYEKTAFKKSK